MKRLEDKSKALAHAIAAYTTDAKKFAEQINNVTSNVQLSMDIQEKNEAKYDALFETAYAMVTQVATFFGGPLGYALATTGKKCWDAYHIDGNLVGKMANTILAGATSSLTGRILLDTASSNTKNNIFFYSMAPLYQTKSNQDAGTTVSKNYDPNSTSVGNELYNAKYNAMNSVTGFFDAMVRSGTPGAVEAKTPEQQIAYLEKNQEKYAEYTIDKAISYVVISTFQLQEVMEDTRNGAADKYRNLYYKSFSDLLEGIQIKPSHAGSDHRKILERFFGDQDEYGLEIDQARARGINIRDNLMKRALVARRQFGWEWLAKDTDYNRKFIKLAVDPSEKYNPHRKKWYPANDWNNIEQTHLHTNNEFKIASFQSDGQDIPINIDRKSYFKLIDIKCCLWAYMGDYNSYFKKKLKSDLKRDLGNFIPSQIDLGAMGMGGVATKQELVTNVQKYWTDSYYVFKGEAINHRTHDLATIYLLMKIPEIVLGVPIHSFIIEGDTPKDRDESILKVVCALYLAASAVAYFYLEEKSKRTTSSFGRNDIKDAELYEAHTYTELFVYKLSGILFSPFDKFKLKNDVTAENLTKADSLGFSDLKLDNNHNNVIINNIFNTYFNRISDDLKKFAKATTPIDKNLTLDGVNRLDGNIAIGLDRRLDAYIAADDPLVITNAYIEKYPDFTDTLKLSPSNVWGEKDFQTISSHYGKLGAAAISGGVAVLFGEAANYGNNGENYLKVSVGTLNSKIKANTNNDDDNKIARYDAIRKSFVKQRLSMQALQAKKVSPEEVLENMEETMMLLASEVFQDIDKLQNKQIKRRTEQRRKRDFDANIVDRQAEKQARHDMLFRSKEV